MKKYFGLYSFNFGLAINLQDMFPISLCIIWLTQISIIANSLAWSNDPNAFVKWMCVK